MKDLTSNSAESGSLLQNRDLLYKMTSFQYSETVDNMMEKNVYLCRPDDFVRDVAAEMGRRKISSVVVTDEQMKPLGIVTERDMVRKIIAECTEGGPDRKVADIMTPDPICLMPSSTLFDALSLLSKNAIKHLPIIQMERVVGILTLRQIMKIRFSEPFVIIGDLEKAHDPEGLKKIKESLIQLVAEKIESNIDPIDIVTMLSLVNAGIHKRLLSEVLKEQNDPPPVDFCFFVTGSHGRRENLLFPDQDFCIIIDDYDDDHYNEFDAYFLRVSLAFSEYLDKVGFPYCSGYVMGQNPTWRKRISEWIKHVTYIFDHQNDYTVRYMTLLFDSAHLYGNKALFETVFGHVFREMAKHHNILRSMNEEVGGHKVPLGWFSTFITEKDKDHRGEIDMKKSGLIFIIEAARILALKNGIRATSTLMRLRGLVEKGIIQADDSEYLENAYRVILYHTLKAQADNFLLKAEHNYYLKPGDLSARNREILKEAFKAISKLQDIVSSEFGDLMI